MRVFVVDFATKTGDKLSGRAPGKINRANGFLGDAASRQPVLFAGQTTLVQCPQRKRWPMPVLSVLLIGHT